MIALRPAEVLTLAAFSLAGYVAMVAVLLNLRPILRVLVGGLA